MSASDGYDPLECRDREHSRRRRRSGEVARVEADRKRPVDDPAMAAESDLVIVVIPKAEPPTVIERIAHALD